MIFSKFLLTVVGSLVLILRHSIEKSSDGLYCQLIYFSLQIKLLELRRDVGLRFLERAFQESHITINNLIQAVNARLDLSDFDEYIDKNYEALFECLILSIFPL